MKQLISSIKPKGFGCIIRTVAEGKRVAELDLELKTLLKRWTDAIAKIQKNKALTQPKFPLLCYEETSRTVALLRDLFNPSYENIYVDDESVYKDVQDYVRLIAPDRQQIVKLYKGKVPIFDNFSVTKQIKTSFGRTITYKHGAYLIIEHTEALHVVDVNSGNRSKSPEGQEVNALDVNLGAADELARQLRLRDMGGIMKITRQRVRPAMDVKVEESCPTCGGTGKIKSSLLFTDALEGKIQMLADKLNYRKIRLHVHPFVAAYLDKGLLSLRRKWQLRHKINIQVIPNQKLSYLQYLFYDRDGQEIDMREENEMQ